MLPDSEGGWLVVIGVTFIVIGGLVMLLSKVWHDNYEAGGHDANHRRPKVLEPWHVEPSGENVVVSDRKGAHRLNGAPGEETRLLLPTTNAARSRVVLIGPEGIEDGNHAGTSGRVRLSQEEDEQEEGREDRERGEDEGRPLEDGEEGSGHEEAPGPLAAQARWFRNTVTGEYVFVDEWGRRVDFDA